jgi:hypothetical protein
MKERWLPVSGFEGLYDVSNLGRVRSRKRTVFVVTSRVKNGYWITNQEKILRPRQAKKPKQYPNVILRKNNQSISWAVHLMVLTAFVGPCPEGMECRHLNGDPGDARLSNLKWGTWRQNHEDKVRHGRLVAGERQWNSKLKATDVKHIKKELASGGRGIIQRLAAQFSVNAETIRDIQAGRTWK